MQGPVSPTVQDAAPRSVLESGPPATAVGQGKELTEAPSLNRISDPSPHSSGSGDVAGRQGDQASNAKANAGEASGRRQASSGEPQTGKAGSCGHASTASAPSRSLQKKADAGSSKGAHEGASDKAKTGCWCF